jgi:hypothetical protein
VNRQPHSTAGSETGAWYQEIPLKSVEESLTYDLEIYYFQAPNHNWLSRRPGKPCGINRVRLDTPKPIHYHPDTPGRQLRCDNLLS